MTARQIKKYAARVKRRRFLRRLMLLFALCLLLLLAAERNFRPLVLSLAEARSAALASQALLDAMAESMGDGVGYEEMMHVRMDNNGQVALLSANTVRMNQLADRAGSAALRRLGSMNGERVSVPLGAVMGLSLFAGSGPDIPVSIVPVGSVRTEFATEFEACGINQTRHKVYLSLTASIRIVIPTGAKTANVTANMLVTESIIVGGVPEGFVGYNLSQDELDLVQ
ncbi:MAG: sporulation protein YunB [Clostridia bacterium]|nr:sporulation protein YunB [Clostridia bacterium]